MCITFTVSRRPLGSRLKEEKIFHNVNALTADRKGKEGMRTHSIFMPL
jgi:hypothetical protein